MKQHLSVLLLMLHVCTCPGLRAQAPTESTTATTAAAAESATLTATRASFLRQVMADSQLLTEQYERALAKTETEVAANGDYEEARAISQRRAQLRALYAGTASSLATPLPLAQARLTGASQVSGEMITGWRSTGSGAEWQNFRLQPGQYYCEFEANMSDAPVAGSIYASSKFQPQQSADFEFTEMTVLGPSAENRRSFAIPRSVDETTFTTVRVGPLNFTNPPVTLRLTSTAGYPANIIRIRNLRLAPVTEEAVSPVAANPTNAATALQQATSTLKSALDAAKASTTEAYLDDLKKLEVKTPTLKDQIQAETRRILRLSDKKTGPTGIRAIASAAGGLDGFEDISDAHLVEDGTLSGERFKVMHEGRTLTLRLLWVHCAPTEEGGPGAKAFAKYFKIEEEDAMTVGLAAKRFTLEYLSNKPLRLLIRPDRDEDGTSAALVFLPDLGLYQNLLVDRGLAAITPPPRDSKRNATEKALIATLHARENEARNRKPAVGAWALTTEPQEGKKP